MNSNLLGQTTYKASSVKGEWLRYYPHALGVVLGTAFDEFESLCGVNGLAKEYGGIIEILAVHSANPGTGQFRTFIDSLKESFSEIYIWEVWNPDLEQTLERYGFKRTQRVEPDETIKRLCMD